MPSNGNEVLKALAVRFEHIADVELKARVFAAINLSMKRTEHLIVLSALSKLPKSGGLAQWVADAPIWERSKVTNQHLFGTWIVQGRPGHDFRSLNNGRLRHPVFGDRENWAEQKIPKGYFSEPIIKNLPFIYKAVEEAAFSVLRGV